MPRASENLVGSVLSLWRYPVKSMQGEELCEVQVGERGLLGDRAYALLDKCTARVVSAKNPAKWGKLLDLHATFARPFSGDGKIPPARITFPDDSTVSSELNNINQILSNQLARDVMLATVPPKAAKFEEYWPDMDGLARRDTVSDEPMAVGAPAGTFFDLAAVHLLTTATLDRLREAQPQGRFEAQRFRPNIVVESPSHEKSFSENSWVGHMLAVGEEARLSIIIPCPRCVMTTLAQGDLAPDPGILRTVAQQNRVMIAPLGRAMPSAGVYATVVCGGTVRRGDPVRLLGSSRLRSAAVFARAYWRLLVSH